MSSACARERWNGNGGKVRQYCCVNVAESTRGGGGGTLRTVVTLYLAATATMVHGLSPVRKLGIVPFKLSVPFILFFY